LNVVAGRLVMAAPEGTAGLIPGNGSTCFVSDTTLLGTVTSCTQAGWASTHNGWGVVGTVNGKTVVQGVVPDSVTRVEFAFSGAAPAAVVLNADQAYSEVFSTEPVKITWYTGGLIVGQTAFEAGTPRAYFN
jgi:hypothetical protein